MTRRSGACWRGATLDRAPHLPARLASERRRQHTISAPHRSAYVLREYAPPVTGAGLWTARCTPERGGSRGAFGSRSPHLPARLCPNVRALDLGTASFRARPTRTRTACDRCRVVDGAMHVTPLMTPPTTLGQRFALPPPLTGPALLAPAIFFSFSDQSAFATAAALARPRSLTDRTESTDAFRAVSPSRAPIPYLVLRSSAPLDLGAASSRAPLPRTTAAPVTGAARAPPRSRGP